MTESGETLDLSQTLITNPLKAYAYSDQTLQEMCGLLPFFWLDAMLQRPATAAEAMSLIDGYYGQRTGSFPKTQVTPEGRWVSPYEDDEPLDPLVQMVSGNGLECFIYPYGLMAIRDTDQTELECRRLD